MAGETLCERRWRQRWSIGIYEGESPLDLHPRGGVSYPVLSAEAVTDVPAAFVADPFLVRENGTWHLFFELWNRATGRGEIGHQFGISRRQRLDRDRFSTSQIV